MANPGESSSEEQRPIGQRLIKLALALVALVILYFVSQDMIGNLLSGARRSKLDGDRGEISKAIERWELTNKKSFDEWDLDKLQGSTMANFVRDPEGHPYVFDWFFRRLVYVGPDGALQTVVPGKTVEPGDSDDEVRNLHAWDRVLYARADETGTILELANADGSEPKQVAAVPGAVLGVHGLATKDANKIVVESVGGQLSIADLSAPQPVLTPLVKGEWPALFGETTEWVFYASGGHIYKLSYKDRVPAKLTSGAGPFGEPSVELKSHWVWYAGRAGGEWSLFKFQLSSYGEPQRGFQTPGRDLHSPAPSANGELIAYLASSGGKTVLEVADVKNGKVVLSEPNVLPDSRICWSPDDQKIGYLAKKDDGVHMVLTHVTKKVSLVLPALVIGRSFAWLHD